MKQYLLLQLVIQTILLALLTPSEGIAEDKYQIKSIKAYFYYHETGFLRMLFGKVRQFLLLQRE